MFLMRKEAEENKLWWSLMSFFMRGRRDVSNWKEIKEKNMHPQTSLTLYRGLSWSPPNLKLVTLKCQYPLHGPECQCAEILEIPKEMPSFFNKSSGMEINFEEHRCTSWTTDIKVAEYFAEPAIGTNVIIIKCTFAPEQMVFSTDHMIGDLFIGHRWQKEIVISPHNFVATVV